MDVTVCRLTFRVLCNASACSGGTDFCFLGELCQGLAMCFSTHQEVPRFSSSRAIRESGDLERSLKVDSIRSGKAFDDGREEGVPCEVTLTAGW